MGEITLGIPALGEHRAWHSRLKLAFSKHAPSTDLYVFSQNLRNSFPSSHVHFLPSLATYTSICPTRHVSDSPSISQVVRAYVIPMTRVHTRNTHMNTHVRAHGCPSVAGGYLKILVIIGTLFSCLTVVSGFLSLVKVFKFTKERLNALDSEYSRCEVKRRLIS